MSNALGACQAAVYTDHSQGPWVSKYYQQAIAPPSGPDLGLVNPQRRATLVSGYGKRAAPHFKSETYVRANLQEYR